MQEFSFLAPPDPDSVASSSETALETLRELRESIVQVSARRDRANTLEPLDRLYEKLGGLHRNISLLRNTHPEEAIRRQAEACEQDLAQFATELSLDEELYAAIHACDTDALDEIAKRFVEHTLRDFRRSGVDLEDSRRDRLREIRAETVRLSQEFARNIVGDVRSITLDSVDELDGLPSDYISLHPPDAEGKVRVTTDYPDYNPFLSYATSGERRRQLYLEFRQRAWPQNLDVLARILELRHERVGILGYDSWAAYVTEDKMVRTADAIAEFIERVATAADQRSLAEYEKLLRRKQRDEPNATEVFDWEKTYYEERIKVEELNVDSRLLRPYFQYTAVKDGILELVSELFGVEFRLAPDAPAWHPSVEVYDVIEGAETVGRIYLDMHPRDGKFKHAAMFPLVSGVRGRAPQAALICNFNDPDSGAGPALLDHDEVVTFFHEFGHLLHHLFSRDHEWVGFSGTGTEWDFVEVPSQLLEEWAWDVDVLQRFAHHHETGEVIPGELVESLRKADQFGTGLHVRQQMYYASLSLRFHERDPAEIDIETLQTELQNRYSRFRYVEDTHFVASFGHLDGYSALYYTYMWSLVIEKDLADVFKGTSLLEPETARRYRECILAPGGTRDAADLVKSFLGREYRFDAFQRWLDEAAQTLSA